MKSATRNPQSAITPRQRVLSQVAFNQYRLRVRAEAGHDDRLLKLTHGTGLLAGNIQAKQWQDVRDVLARLAAWSIGWVEVLGENRDVLTLVHQERDRQQQLLKAGKFTFTCASIVADPQRKLRVLVEEVGEVAEAIEKVEMKKLDAINHLRSELIQVASVCVAWLEALDTPVKIVNRKS